MGNWNINIQGVGCHHNGKPEIDADLASKEFVKTLQKQGHTIESATFTYGGKEELSAIKIWANRPDETMAGITADPPKGITFTD